MQYSYRNVKSYSLFLFWITDKTNMTLRAFKYLSPLIVYIGSFRAFTITGWEIWVPLIYAWIIVPVMELFTRPEPANMSAAEEEIARNDKSYDYFLYLVVLLQYAALTRFLYAMSHDQMSLLDIIGRIWVMGILCGVFGINVGHELGHRASRFEQTLAKMLLLTSLYIFAVSFSVISAPGISRPMITAKKTSRYFHFTMK
jgi:alkane 1-monooxygenase